MVFLHQFDPCEKQGLDILMRRTTKKNIPKTLSQEAFGCLGLWIPLVNRILLFRKSKRALGLSVQYRKLYLALKPKMSFVVCEWSNNFQFNVLTPMPCLRNILLLPRWSAHWTNSITMALRWTMGRL